MDILKKFHRVCDNIHPTHYSDGKKVWYKHPVLAEISNKAIERGDKYFYLTPEFQYPIQETEPHYIYKVDNFTEDEFNFLIKMLGEKV